MTGKMGKTADWVRRCELVSINQGNSAMQHLKDIDHKNNLGFFRFLIENNNEKVIIKYESLLNKNRGIILPDNEMLIIQMHVANIPDLVTAIFTIFQSNGRDSWKTTAHGDKLEVIMFDDERYFLRLVIRDDSYRVTKVFQHKIEFEFEDRIYMNDLAP